MRLAAWVVAELVWQCRLFISGRRAVANELKRFEPIRDRSLNWSPEFLDKKFATIAHTREPFLLELGLRGPEFPLVEDVEFERPHAEYTKVEELARAEKSGPLRFRSLHPALVQVAYAHAEFDCAWSQMLAHLGVRVQACRGGRDA